MSLRNKIERAVGGGVELHVPPADPMQQIVKQANTLGEQLTAIMDDRNLHKQRSEQLMLMLQDANRQIERLVAERNESHRQFMIMLHGNGQMKTMIEGIASLIHNGKDMMHRTDHLLAKHPEHENGKDAEPLSLDAVPQGPSLEEVEQIRATLAKLPQQ